MDSHSTSTLLIGMMAVILVARLRFSKVENSGMQAQCPWLPPALIYQIAELSESLNGQLVVQEWIVLTVDEKSALLQKLQVLLIEYESQWAKLYPQADRLRSVLAATYQKAMARP